MPVSRWESYDPSAGSVGLVTSEEAPVRGRAAASLAFMAIVVALAAPAGAAAPRAAVPSCTITGTEGPDYLRGTTGPDVICALGGDDIVLGWEGADSISGGDGADYLRGGEGADEIRGDAGDDTIDAGKGSDRAYGGGGNDRIFAGEYGINDYLFGQGGDDLLIGRNVKQFGNAGDDVLNFCGFSASDPAFANGGPGTDTVLGLSAGYAWVQAVETFADCP